MGPHPLRRQRGSGLWPLNEKPALNSHNRNGLVRAQIEPVGNLHADL
jgi:hypothetical protein